MPRVLLGLGSNLGDRARNLGAALGKLEEKAVVRATSAVYETAPRDVAEQPHFLNMAVEVETDLEPARLLAWLKEIEGALGRRPGPRHGPRLIDIDILAMEERIVREPDLQVPHPRLRERAFALRPLADIAPYWRHPLTGETVTDMLAALGEDQGVWLEGPAPEVPRRDERT